MNFNVDVFFLDGVRVEGEGDLQLTILVFRPDIVLINLTGFKPDGPRGGGPDTLPEMDMVPGITTLVPLRNSDGEGVIFKDDPDIILPDPGGLCRDHIGIGGLHQIHLDVVGIVVVP